MTSRGRWVAGSPAEALLRDAASGDSVLRTAVVGAAGTGKSTLLCDLESACAEAGIPTSRSVDALTDAHGPLLVLLDDVHEDAADVPGDGPRDPSVGLVVAARPGCPPGSPGAALLSRMRRHGPPIVLGQLDLDELTDLVASAFPGAGRATVEAVSRWTDGEPWLVHALLDQMARSSDAAAFPASAVDRAVSAPSLSARIAVEREAMGSSVSPTAPLARLALGLRPSHRTIGLARALWSEGRLDEAEREVERVVPDDPQTVVESADLSAAIWAARGMSDRAADVYLAAGLGGPLAGLAALTAGRPLTPDTHRSPDHATMPALVISARQLAVEGLAESVGGSPATALIRLVGASDLMNASRALEPMTDVPAVLAALAALHDGAHRASVEILDAAIAAEQGGPPVAARLRLIRAWPALQSGRSAEVGAAIDSALATGIPLAPRDELLRAALEVGAARRADDLAALARLWPRAASTLRRTPIDLTSILPLGELIIAAARMRDTDVAKVRVAEARRLLGGLGGPALWSTLLNWSEVQAAILLGDPRGLVAHAAELKRASGSALGSTLSQATRSWAAVLGGRVDAGAVEGAARRLAAAGLPWDGARLAGHAAAHADDRKDQARLLACARDLRSDEEAHPVDVDHRRDAGQVVAAAPEVPAHLTTESHPDDLAPRRRRPSGLSDRELEVAAQLLEGKTYREIGETIFVSPRTVENHIARIRRRLDATTRSELITRLHAIVDQEQTGSPTPSPSEHEASPNRDRGRGG